jgi:hypothetical protein
MILLPGGVLTCTLRRPARAGRTTAPRKIVGSETVYSIAQPVFVPTDGIGLLFEAEISERSRLFGSSWSGQSG